MNQDRWGAVDGKHFAGTCTWLMLSCVAAKGGEGAVEEVLRRAGETRSIDELYDESGWSSYTQFRALAEAAARVLGHQRCFDDLYEHVALFDTTMPETTEMLQALGSPGALYRSTADSNGLMKVIVSDGLVREVGPTEWVLGARFLDGFEPFPEFCSLHTGMAGLTVKLFGLRVAELEESRCVFRGDDHCAAHIRWTDAGEESEIERLQLRLALAERRMDAVRDTVTDLVSDEDLETVLQRTVTSAAGAMRAPAFVLALEPLAHSSARVLAHGLDDDTATRYADALLDGRGPDAGRDAAIVSVVDVVSTRRRYGFLAAIDPAGNAADYDAPVLAAYARLAATALDSATALEEARHHAASSRALLELSAALAEVTSVEQMAANVARATPIVIDCDTAVVFLVDGDVARVAGTHGTSTEEDRYLRDLELPAGPDDLEAVLGGLSVHTLDEASADVRARMLATGIAASASVPIIVEGHGAGRVVVGVRDDPARITGNPQIEEQLRGLAGQAATALRNAQLLDQVRHQALHDGLTGLPNRTLVFDRAEHLLKRARRQRTSVAALFIDLDEFKTINDTLGHAAGDQLLQAVATRLKTALRASDTLARLGGDEFIVLTETETLDAGPELVADRVLQVLREPFQLDARAEPLTIGASIGIAVGTEATAGELLRDADVALYEAKADGKGHAVVFAPEMYAAIADRVTTETELRAALPRGELYLLYQPIFDLADERITGVEALLRWHHPERGTVLPDEFIPILEDTDMIGEVGAWVLAAACRQAAAWHADGHPIDVSVNVSPRQLERPELLGDIDRALAASGLPATSLIVEITETTIMQQTRSTIQRLAAIKDLGVRVAIDDFGTGYSSLAYLQRFPVDSIKIDRSFIDVIGDSSESAALARTLVQLGKTLGLGTLAEGIEDRVQIAHLQREHCDSGQGFVLARPLDPDALELLLAAAGTDRAAGPAPQPPPAAARVL